MKFIRNKIISALLLMCLLMPVMADDFFGYDIEPAKVRKVLDDWSETAVMIKYKFFVEQGGQEFERELSARGVMVDESGIVMMPGQSIQPTVRFGGRTMTLNAKISDITVVVNGVTYEAKLASKEFKRDRVFLRVGPEEGEEEIAEGRSFKAVKPSAEEIKFGQVVMIIDRFEETHDYAPRFFPTVVTSVLTEPQDFYTLQMNVDQRTGLPIFDFEGNILGIIGQRAQISANGKVQTYGSAGMLPFKDLKESLEKVDSWANLLEAQEDEEFEEEELEGEEELEEEEGSGSSEGSGGR